MAEIHIERKGRGASPLLWILLLIALAVIGWFAYTYYLSGETTQRRTVTTTTSLLTPLPLPQLA